MNSKTETVPAQDGSRAESLREEFRSVWDSKTLVTCMGTPELGYAVRECPLSERPGEDMQEMYEFFEGVYVATDGGFSFAAPVVEHWGHDGEDCRDGRPAEFDPDDDGSVKAFMDAVLGPEPSCEECD